MVSFQGWGSAKMAAAIILSLAIVIVASLRADVVAIAVLAFDVAILIVGFAIWATWGRDPLELDDDSVLAAGPPAGLRPCLAVVLHNGRGDDRALRVALLEFAQLGLIEIHDDPLVGNGAYIPRAWIDAKSVTRHQWLIAQEGLGQPEDIVAESLGLERRGSARLDYVDVVTAVGSARPDFEGAVDDELIAAGWYRRPPFRTAAEWLDVADIVLVGGLVGVVAAIFTTSLPLLVAYVGLVAAGWVGRQIAAAMPARTHAGAIVAAMLKAYRRSLRDTLAIADSVWDVLGVQDLAWFKTPDRMIVWAMALDLEHDLSAMFARANQAAAGEPWFPDWFGTTVPDPDRMFRSLDGLIGSASP